MLFTGDYMPYWHANYWQDSSFYSGHRPERLGGYQIVKVVKESAWLENKQRRIRKRINQKK
jgi:hypothetical protein